MPNKEQISVRLSGLHLKLLQGLQPLYGDNKSEVARHLLTEALEEKHGLDKLRENRAIRISEKGRLPNDANRRGPFASSNERERVGRARPGAPDG